MEKIFFNGWTDVLRTLIITVLAYVALVIILRGSGKRTLSKMNAFDFVITIALGSALATVSLTKSVTLASGVVAFILLVGMQFLLTFFARKYKAFRSIITNEPSLLLYKGQLMEAAMKRERLSKEELLVAVHNKGIGSLAEVEYIILETTGSLTVIAELKGGGRDSLEPLILPDDGPGQAPAGAPSEENP